MDRQLDEVDAARVDFHRRWLAHLLAPDVPEFEPRFSIVIPVYNRAAKIAECIESCLAQTYRAHEIIVVDDGSTDDLDAAIAPFLGRIVLRRQPNRGVSNARNEGIRLATGEYVHFLDSDNLLESRCLEMKIAACRIIADAELCFSAANEIDTGQRPIKPRIRSFPTGDELCATKNLMNATTFGYPFLVSSVMVARWVFLETGWFDESVTRTEDNRYWFLLAKRGTKVIGLEAPLTIRRGTQGGLSQGTTEFDTCSTVTGLKCLIDVISSPADWCYAAHYLVRLNWKDRWRVVNQSDDPRLETLRGQLLASLGRLATGGSHDGLSPLILAFNLRDAVLRLESIKPHPDVARWSFRKDFLDAIDALASAADPITVRDADYWSRPPYQSWWNWWSVRGFARLKVELDGENPNLDRGVVSEYLRRTSSALSLYVYSALLGKVGPHGAAAITAIIAPVLDRSKLAMRVAVVCHRWLRRLSRWDRRFAGATTAGAEEAAGPPTAKG